jgi:hypothetical protein
MMADIKDVGVSSNFAFLPVRWYTHLDRKGPGGQFPTRFQCSLFEGAFQHYAIQSNPHIILY